MAQALEVTVLPKIKMAAALTEITYWGNRQVEINRQSNKDIPYQDPKGTRKSSQKLKTRVNQARRSQ